MNALLPWCQCLSWLHAEEKARCHLLQKAIGPGDVSLRTPALFFPRTAKKRVILQVMLRNLRLSFSKLFERHICHLHTLCRCWGFHLPARSVRPKKGNKKPSGSKRQPLSFYPRKRFSFRPNSLLVTAVNVAPTSREVPAARDHGASPDR